MARCIVICFLLIFINGCNLVPPIHLKKPEYRNIRVTRVPPPQSCQYLGDVYGAQGNWFSGIFTSNIYILMGAINDLRNNGAQMGANYLYIPDVRFTGPGFLAGSNFSNIAAQAYKCTGADKPEPNLIIQKECGYFSFCMYDGDTKKAKKTNYEIKSQKNNALKDSTHDEN